MHYLIDGHNLIAKMPDISLDDPDDEVKLVLRLRQWTAGRRKRRVTVIFDGGLPGGAERHLSSRPVKVIFASAGQSADALLINRIQDAKNPAEFTLIYGTPIPGYHAPPEITVPAAARILEVFGLIFATAYLAGKLQPPKQYLDFPDDIAQIRHPMC